MDARSMTLLELIILCAFSYIANEWLGFAHQFGSVLGCYGIYYLGVIANKNN